MKNPIRLLCAAVGGLHFPMAWIVYPRMAAGGLCAAALLMCIRAYGSHGRPPEKRLERIRANFGKPLSGQRNSHLWTPDPARELTDALTLRDRSEREKLLRVLLSGWAACDAEAAMNWVSTLEDPTTRSSTRSTVCLTVAKENPHRAIVLALAHGADKDEHDGLLECLTMQWCEKNTGEVLTWARGQPPGEWRNRLLGRASFVLSKSEPAAAAQIVAGLEPGDLQDEAAMAVLHQWALQDSAGALRWAEAFSEPTLRERALSEISNLRTLTISLQEFR